MEIKKEITKGIKRYRRIKIMHRVMMKIPGWSIWLNVVNVIKIKR